MTAWVYRCALLGGVAGGPGAGTQLWPAGQSLGQSWDRGTSLVLAGLELNQEYLGLGRCP